MALAPARTATPSPAPSRSQLSSLPVSRPGDRGEREAERIASRIASTNPARIGLLPLEEGPGAAGSGGHALPPALRQQMEAHLGVDLGGVRLHTDADAAREADQLDARAFTVGSNIHFGAGQYRPDSPDGRELIAHELVHTVQQGAAVQRALLPGAQAVHERSPPMIQRGLFSRALRRARRYLAGLAEDLPGYRLFCLAIGYNPIAGEDVSRNGPNVLRAIAGVVPFGDTVLEALQNHGILARGAEFIVTQFGALRSLGSGIISDIRAFIADLGLSDVARPGRLWDRVKALAHSSIRRVVGFFANLVSDFAALVRDAILRPLGAWAARNVPYWNLLVGVLGRNPVSDESQSPAEAIIGAFMTLIGQQEVWQNIQQSGAIGKAWNWFRKALGGAKALVLSIPGRVMAIFTGLSITDLLTIPRVFGRIVTTFADFATDLGGWALGTVLNLLEIILSVVAPGAVPYLKRAGAAFASILRNPIGFVRNLIRAGRQGLNRFVGKVAQHLKDALIRWLTGSMAGTGIHIPASLSLPEILRFVLSVLGLTWVQVRVRLVAAVGETSVRAMEGGFALVKTLITQGPAAAWQQIIAAVGNLQAMAVDAVITFVKGKVVQAAITALLSMLSPVSGFIRALVAIYDTIMFFVERLRRIAEVAKSFVDSIAAIARGAIAPAAERVERTMAGLLVVVISFLARLARLGRVSDIVSNLIKKIRDPIEKALDKVVAWVVAQARRLGQFVAQAGVPNDPAQRLRLAARDSQAVARTLRGRVTAPVLERALALLRTRYGLTSLTVKDGPDDFTITAVINPQLVFRAPRPGETSGAGGVSRVASVRDPATGELHAGVEGTIGPAQNRTTAPNFNDQMPRIGSLPGAVRTYVQGFEWAHLYGPGFGDEAATGLMLASPQVNRLLQSLGRTRGIEGRIRELADIARARGGQVRARVIGQSFPDPPPGVPAALGRIGQPVLSRVEYRLTVVAPDGREMSGYASIEVGPLKAGGSGGIGLFDPGTLFER